MRTQNQDESKKGTAKKLVLGCLVLLLVAALGGGGYLIMSGKGADNTDQTASFDPDDYVEVAVSGHELAMQNLEPGWDVKSLMNAHLDHDPDQGDASAQAAADNGVIVADPGKVASAGVQAEADAQAELRAAHEAELEKAKKGAEHRDRLARLKKRLDAMRAKQAAEADDDAHQEVADSSVPTVRKGVIAPGETVSQLLDDYLSPAEVEELAQLCKDVYPLSQVRAGNAYAVTVWEGDLKRFEYSIDRTKNLVVRKTSDGFKVGEKQVDFDIYTVRVAGDISLSLFGAIERQGESGALAMRLADIFGWEIDFIRDIRAGDSFRVLVEKRMHDGKLIGYGDILAAEFTNQGIRYQGFLFHDELGYPGYFDPDGESLKKAFLKVPLKFSRISSDFSWRRLHPILNKYRPHPGIDYAAPTGTPIHAVGNGTVTFAGWMRGGGNSIKLRHMNGYETYYMHMSRLAKGMKKGVKVEQGQVIGYVGSTGLATGPHLDYRMKKNGNFLNPHKVENPRAAALPDSLMAAFTKRVRQLTAHLENEKFQPVLDFALDKDGIQDVAAR